tara:strand:+ start:464 stop:655 length:192 start_codon:yes stop_codon:yes gene_type:complete
MLKIVLHKVAQEGFDVTVERTIDDEALSFFFADKDKALEFAKNMQGILQDHEPVSFSPEPLQD